MSDAGADPLPPRVEALEGGLRDLTQRLVLLEALVKDLVLRLPTGGGAPAPRPPAPVSDRYLVVRVDARLLGVPLLGVREVVRTAALQLVPDAPPALDGLLDLRGEPVEVVDLRVALGAEPLQDDLDCRVLVVDLDGRAFGLKVDQVLDLLRVDPRAVEPPPGLTRSAYLTGVARADAGAGDPEALVLLLDLPRLLDALEQDEPLELPARPDPAPPEDEA